MSPHTLSAVWVFLPPSFLPSPLLPPTSHPSSVLVDLAYRMQNEPGFPYFKEMYKNLKDVATHSVRSVSISPPFIPSPSSLHPPILPPSLLTLRTACRMNRASHTSKRCIKTSKMSPHTLSAVWVFLPLSLPPPSKMSPPLHLQTAVWVFVLIPPFLLTNWASMKFIKKDVATYSVPSVFVPNPASSFLPLCGSYVLLVEQTKLPILHGWTKNWNFKKRGCYDNFY